jgi:predicted transposase/invertase (TIGR01784 family)
MKTKQPATPEGKPLNPLNDFLFYKYMGEPGDEVQLKAFINAVLADVGLPLVQAITIRENTTQAAAVVGGKKCVLDVLAVTERGTKVNVEVQVRDYGDMERRTVLYLSREYARGIKEGDQYAEVPSVITINLVDFGLLPLEEFHTCFHLREDRHPECVLTDAVEIHFLDMVKFRRLKEKDENNPMHRWLMFVDKHTSANKRKEITTMDTAMQQAMGKIALAMRDPVALRTYEKIEQAEMDYRAGMYHAEQRGVQLGEQRGYQRARAESAAIIADLQRQLSSRR